MLEGMDAVDWSGLRHAYGAAEDVPALIRALISPSADERRAALTELYGNLWHQGTIYEATSHAVPFLIELAGSDKTPARHEILSYLGTLAGGSSFADVHKNSMRLSEEELSARLERELNWVQQTRRAVKSGEALYLATLRNREHPICCAAAYVLSRFPEEGERYWTSLRVRYEAAHDDALVRCGIAILTKEFSATGGADSPWLAAMLEQESLLAVRIPLAVSIALSDREPREDALRFLTANLLVGNELKQLYHAQPFDSGEAASDIVKALCASNRGTRMLISRFNQLLAGGAQNKQLEYIRYLLSGERTEEVDRNEFEGPLRPLTLPNK
jgi:hypothetical protein